MGAPTYSEEELIKLYENKIFEKGRKVYVKEIDNDPNLPAYSTFYRRFGGEKEIIKKSSFNYKCLNKLSKICDDCLYDPKDCGNKPIECYKEVTNYFSNIK